MLLKNLKLFLLSRLSNRILRDSQLLRKKQDMNLKKDVENVLYYKQWIIQKTNNTFDNTRVLGIVATAKGSEKFLPYTIPKILEQVSQTGMMADIVIGLNNGFECPSVIDRFTLLPNVQVIHLYTNEKLANNIPAKIFDNLMCAGKPYLLTNIVCPFSQHRIFVVHQKEGLHAAGKIRVLGDIYCYLLLNSIENGWIPPAILFTFDAESQFLLEPEYPFLDLDSNGLELIISHLNKHPQIDIISARNRFAVYQKSMEDGIEILLPDFSQEIPPIQLFLDLMHGRHNGFRWMQGGGTFGRTDALISLLVVIAQTYPGIRVEDTQLTILAKYAGFIYEVLLDVISVNRTPSPTEVTMDKPPKQVWIEQVSRWSCGHYALELCYGKHNISTITSGKIPLSIFTEVVNFPKRVKGKDKLNSYTIFHKLKILTIALLIGKLINKNSLKHPDILQGREAKACW
ncbi:MAG: hypothetical protein RMY28_014215 [Nostoc sp. ChiSLP01]|nr:hypothetical protein [Nostoc sp. CmiSLP01]MDZ8286449.1 hypothetical protein [Nostoc sp. ChiSLP01]